MSKTIPISVVIPCYRVSGCIHRAVKSVVAQTCRPLEVILIDDGSGDDTLDKMVEIQNIYGSDWIKILALGENGGASVARNAGWNEAVGEWVAFLDADDTWLPNKLEVQYSYLINNPLVFACGHQHIVSINDSFDSESVPSSSVTESSQVGRLLVLITNPFVTPSVMVRRNVCHRFSVESRYMEDHRLWQSMVFSGLRVDVLHIRLVVLHKMQFGDGGLSSNLLAMEMGELSNYKELYLHGHISAFVLVIMYIYSLLKYFRRLAIVLFRKLKWV